MIIVLTGSPDAARASRVDDTGMEFEAESVPDVPLFVGAEERPGVRWVWDDTKHWYPRLLAAGVRVERCFDLRLCHAILRGSQLTSGSVLAEAPAGVWDGPPLGRAAAVDGTLFELDRDDPAFDADPLEEFRMQRAAVAGSPEPARIGLLLAAESAGALTAEEMRYAGLPWRPSAHDAILSALLGPRPADPGERPERMQSLAVLIRQLLDAPELNPDSPAEVLQALGRAGIAASSTRSFELEKIRHPAIAPLLEYKKLARLLSSNGWHWLETWVTEGRFHPDYVPAGVVTGRWASSGGGALQLPKVLRRAVVADDGWKLVVADAAQLEPRILAAMSGDRQMVEASTAGDLYDEIVASGTLDTRAQAKVAMLGAMYGAVRGESGRLLPKLAKAYPKAIGMVEDAARAGERAELVTTRLGRSSPPARHPASYDEARTVAETSRAREEARSWGRFTRNFIVQGTAAEWALCWMAGIRRRLSELGGGQGAWPAGVPHLVFFLHDEVVVHCPAELAEQVRERIADAAAEAGRLLFGEIPVHFPVTVDIVDDYGQAG